MVSLSKKLTDAIKKEVQPDELGAIKIDYGMTIIKNELIKLILLIMLFAFIGMVSAGLFCMAIIIPVRLFSGGIHMHSNFACFVASFVFFFLPIVLLPMLPVSREIYFVLLISSIAIISLLSPIASEKRPIISKEKYVNCKRMALIFSLLAGCAIILVMHNLPLFHSGIWIMTLQAAQLVMAYVRQPKRDIKYHNA